MVQGCPQPPRLGGQLCVSGRRDVGAGRCRGREGGAWELLPPQRDIGPPSSCSCAMRGPLSTPATHSMPFNPAAVWRSSCLSPSHGCGLCLWVCAGKGGERTGEHGLRGGLLARRHRHLGDALRGRAPVQFWHPSAAASACCSDRQMYRCYLASIATSWVADNQGQGAW